MPGKAEALAYAGEVTERARLVGSANTLVATDGHRLALAEMIAPEGSAGTPGVIVPRKTVNEARRLLEDAGETVDLALSPQKVRFEFGGAVLTSKVIDGNFPDYVRVIPRDNDRVMMVDNKLFAKAVDRVATISAEKSRSVRMAIEPGRVILTVRNMEAGQAVEEIEVDYSGESFELSFNARYLLDVTDQIGAEQAEFLAACTVSFNHFTYPPAEGLEGAALFRRAYEDPSIGFIAAQVAAHINDWANFTTSSAAS